MNAEQIEKLISRGHFPEGETEPELVETHISWVILFPRYTYKIKKPVHYSFLDFSTAKKREYYCHREIELNRRLTDKIYREVMPVMLDQGRIFIGPGSGQLIDHAVQMFTQDRNLQMDRLLAHDRVGESHVRELARKIGRFHDRTAIIADKDPMDIQEKFNDLESQGSFLEVAVGEGWKLRIREMIDRSDSFLEQHRHLLQSRVSEGYIRDGHGDLHSRNIFLLPSPEPFDCIEFNDDFRQVDVLNDIAFLCMDLEAVGRSDLSKFFVEEYNRVFPAIKSPAEKELLIYYKSYRANIRAKVNVLRARSLESDAEREPHLKMARQYLAQMEGYLKVLKKR